MEKTVNELEKISKKVNNLINKNTNVNHFTN